MIILLLAINNKGVFFTQLRPGRAGELFRIIKFKTLYNQRNLSQDQSQESNRLGSFLRKFSFDELPQLINVLRGDMSIVGPRPWLKEYLHLYTKAQMKRHDVKPGITGLAQIRGGNALPWEQRIELDLIYIAKTSFLYDIHILLQTIKVLTKPKNKVDFSPKFEG